MEYTDRAMFLVSPCANIEGLSSRETLRYTLNHSRTESFRHLLQKTVGAERLGSPMIPPLSTRRSILQEQRTPISLLPTDLVSRPRSRSITALHLRSPPPNERDYKRMITKLDKIIHGSALSFKCVTISDSKPADLTLDDLEWQYLKIKLQGLPIPLRVSIHRSKGRLVSYISRTTEEPTEFLYEEMHTGDDFMYSEPGIRFKSAWLYVGLKCVEEASFTVSVKFGFVRKPGKKAVGVRKSVAEDLEGFRRDEEKRKELDRKVKEVLEKRKELMKGGSTVDFVRKNKGEERLEEREKWREMQVQRRVEVIYRHRAQLHSRKAQALATLQRQDLRREAAQAAQAALQLKLQFQHTQRLWLALSTFLSHSQTLHHTWHKTKTAQEEIARKMAAAQLIQRCFRRVRLFVNPKRRARERMIHHLKLYVELFGEVVRTESKEMIIAVMRRGVKANDIKNKAVEMYQRGKS